MQDFQLSEHFKLSEFTRSSTATRYGIDNTLNPSNPEHAKIIANLKHLCENILEPLRAHINESSPIKGGSRGVFIGSGYRCPELNTLVGGKDKSKHLTGHAADIHIPNNKIGKEWMLWIIDHCRFHKVIWETADKKHYWIHVGYVEGDNDNIVISYLLKTNNSPNR